MLLFVWPSLEWRGKIRIECSLFEKMTKKDQKQKTKESAAFDLEQETEATTLTFDFNYSRGLIL